MGNNPVMGRSGPRLQPRQRERVRATVPRNSRNPRRSLAAGADGQQVRLGQPPLVLGDRAPGQHRFERVRIPPAAEEFAVNHGRRGGRSDRAERRPRIGQAGGLEYLLRDLGIGVHVERLLEHRHRLGHQGAALIGGRAPPGHRDLVIVVVVVVGLFACWVLLALTSEIRLSPTS